MKTLLFVLMILLLSSCADIVDVQECVPNDPYGFWAGLWHGWCAPFSFWGYLFSDDIAVFAINNNGGFYMFGFLLGIGAFASGTTTTVKTIRK